MKYFLKLVLIKSSLVKITSRFQKLIRETYVIKYQQYIINYLVKIHLGSGNHVKFRLQIDELHFNFCKPVHAVYNQPDFVDEGMQRPSHLIIK